jgi:hypothetical protein
VPLRRNVAQPSGVAAVCNKDLASLAIYGIGSKVFARDLLGAVMTIKAALAEGGMLWISSCIQCYRMRAGFSFTCDKNMHLLCMHLHRIAHGPSPDNHRDGKMRM